MEDAAKGSQGKKRPDTWQEGLLQIYYAVRENKPFIMNVYRCVDREQVERYLKPLADRLLMDVVEEQAVGMTVREGGQSLYRQSVFLCVCRPAAGLDQEDMKEEPKAACAEAVHGREDTFRDALERFRTDKALSKQEN